MGQGVEEFTSGSIGNARVLQDLGELETESWHARFGERVLDVALIEDVPLAILGDEENACWVIR